MAISLKEVKQIAESPKSMAHGYGSTARSTVIDTSLAKAAALVPIELEVLRWYLESPHSIKAMENLTRAFKGGFTKEIGSTKMLAFWMQALGVAKDLYRETHPTL